MRHGYLKKCKHPPNQVQGAPGTGGAGVGDRRPACRDPAEGFLASVRVRPAAQRSCGSPKRAKQAIGSITQQCGLSCSGQR